MRLRQANASISLGHETIQWAWPMESTCSLWGGTSLWFAGFWSGIIGTYPGTAGGTQTLESFHAYWQILISSQQPGPAEELPAMQTLYENDWAKKFAWHEKWEFATWPQSPGESLYHSATWKAAKGAYNIFNQGLLYSLWWKNNPQTSSTNITYQEDKINS